MHEFNVCQNLLREAHTMARQEYIKRNGNISLDESLVVTSLTLRLSLFSSVNKDLLKRSFQVALHDFHCYWPTTTDTEEMHCNGVYFSPTTQLIIEEVSASIYCRECSTHYPVSQKSFTHHYLSCPNNHSHRTQLISGDEMVLINLQMHPEPARDCIGNVVKKSNTQDGDSHV